MVDHEDVDGRARRCWSIKQNMIILTLFEIDQEEIRVLIMKMLRRDANHRL